MHPILEDYRILLWIHLENVKKDDWNIAALEKVERIEAQITNALTLKQRYERFHLYLNKRGNPRKSIREE